MEWLSKYETCKMLKISINTLDRWLKLKKIPYYKMGEEKTSRVWIKKDDVLKFIKKSKV